MPFGNSRMPGFQRLRAVPFEAVFWTVGLIAIAGMEPDGSGGINLCLLENVGLLCPGDGLGRSIAHLARGQWAASWQDHPLALPVVGGLVYHIVSLVRTSVRPRE